jgi:hypothetical protein
VPEVCAVRTPNSSAKTGNKGSQIRKEVVAAQAAKANKIMTDVVDFGFSFFG